MLTVRLGTDSPTNAVEQVMAIFAIDKTINELREDRHPEALSFRLGALVAPLRNDPVLDRKFTPDQMVKAISGTGETSAFASKDDAARWYEDRNPAMLLKRQLVLLQGNLARIPRSLIDDTVAALGEFRAMCDGMEMLLGLLPREREVQETVFM